MKRVCHCPHFLKFCQYRLYNFIYKVICSVFIIKESMLSNITLVCNNLLIKTKLHKFYYNCIEKVVCHIINPSCNPSYPYLITLNLFSIFYFHLFSTIISLNFFYLAYMACMKTMC